MVRGAVWGRVPDCSEQPGSFQSLGLGSGAARSELRGEGPLLLQLLTCDTGASSGWSPPVDFIFVVFCLFHLNLS